MSALEKQHLIPVPAFETIVPKSIVTYQVRKDNTVVYRSNRYQVPFETYRPGLRRGIWAGQMRAILTVLETIQATEG